jgi:hypothetical protein
MGTQNPAISAVNAGYGNTVKALIKMKKLTEKMGELDAMISKILAS